MEIISQLAMEGQTGLHLSVHFCLSFVSACFDRLVSFIDFFFFLGMFLFGKLRTSGERENGG